MRSWLPVPLALVLFGCPPSEDDVLALYDEDGDGSYVAEASSQGVEGPYDCDDADDAVHPGADEVCNEVDDDCDGEIDAGATDATTWYADEDADGYGDPGSATVACEQPPGHVTDATDCDDADPNATPATEWHTDADGDGFGSATVAATSCEPPAATGYTTDAADCDDLRVDVFPAADEVCDDADNDCDGTIDDGVKRTYWLDADEDGHGGDTSAEACEAPDGYVVSSDDCDDADATAYPGAPEYCDDVDDDCDGTADDSAVDATTWYIDLDSDGYGAAGGVAVCEAPGSTWATVDGDCDDGAASVNPGNPEGNASGECTDKIDNDCDGDIDVDDWDCG